jgi:hypothetical protein
MDRQRSARLGGAARKAVEWRQKRDAEIVQAHQAGDGLREIGRVTGLSHPAVKKIVDKDAGNLEPAGAPTTS